MFVVTSDASVMVVSVNGIRRRRVRKGVSRRVAVMVAGRRQVSRSGTANVAEDVGGSVKITMDRCR